MQLFRAGLAAAVGIACTSTGGCASDPTGETDTAVVPTPYDAGLEAREGAEPLGSAELEEGLAEVLAYLQRQDPLLHHEAWTEVFWGSIEEGVCPVVGDHNGMDYWRDDCTTGGGAHFNGWMLNFRNGGWWDGELVVRQYNWLSGHAFIDPGDGTLLQSYGDLELLIGDGEERDVYAGFVFGAFSWDDPAAVGTWIQEPVTGELYFEFEDYGTHQTMWYDGGLTAFSGPVAAVRFEDVLLGESGGQCAVEPSGTVRLRDREGAWYDVAFGAADASDPACDGCGEARLDASVIGPVCADWSPFVAWEGWPWDA